MRSEYIETIERRLEWLRWSNEEGEAAWQTLGFGEAMPIYRDILEHADTFYMDEHFCRLVDHARSCIPSDVQYDARWLQATCGWLYLEEPFVVPTIKGMKAMMDAKGPGARLIKGEQPKIFVRAIGWRKVPEGMRVKYSQHRGGATAIYDAGEGPVPPGTTQFVCFQDFNYIIFNDLQEQLEKAHREYDVAVAEMNHVEEMIAEMKRSKQENWKDIHDAAKAELEQARRRLDEADRMIKTPTDAPGFGAWSYFLLRDGERLDERIERFERISELHTDNPHFARSAAYEETPERHRLHEIRWIYAALHLMAQRLTISVRHDTDRATRRRAEKRGEQAPPFVRLITLRRLEADRKREGAQHKVEWHWQWIVRGFWRQQWYPSEGVHKPKFIESFVKGPKDRPMRPESIKLFVAAR